MSGLKVVLVKRRVSRLACITCRFASPSDSNGSYNLEVTGPAQQGVTLSVIVSESNPVLSSKLKVV